MLAAFTVVACAPQRAPHSRPSEPPILNTTTVADLVAAFTNAALPVRNAHDVTPEKCPPIHCTAATDSDTVEILKFSNTGAAQQFAGATRDVYQIEDIALVFAADLPDTQRRAYEDVTRKAVAS